MVAGAQAALSRGAVVGLSLLLAWGTAFAAGRRSDSKDRAALAALRPPKEQILLIHMYGRGTENYACVNISGRYMWHFRGPAVELFGEDGQSLGRHVEARNWEAHDGSRISAKALVSIPSPDPAATPWRLTTVISGSGEGILTPVASILRLNTKGGKAPADGCDAAHENAEVRVPFEADYYFYGTSHFVAK